MHRDNSGGGTQDATSVASYSDMDMVRLEAPPGEDDPQIISTSTVKTSMFQVTQLKSTLVVTGFCVSLETLPNDTQH